MVIHSVRRASLTLVLGALVLGLLATPFVRALDSGQSAALVLGHPTFTDGPLTPKQLIGPEGVAVDLATGKVFVADSENNRVLRFGPLASLSNGAAPEGVLGQPDFFSYNEGPSLREMREPSGMAVDGSGRLWVMDSGNRRVLRFDAAGSKPNGAAADGALNYANVAAYSQASSLPDMVRPSGIAVDGSGRLWVADYGNNRVLRFDAAAGKPNGALPDGVLGQPNFASTTAATSAEGMRSPQGVTVDGSGRLWVADYSNNRVLRFDAAAVKPNGAPADGVLGQSDFTSHTEATSAQGMGAPSGLTVDGGGRLWVLDHYHHRVLRFDAAAGKPNGAPADGVLGQSDFVSSTEGISAKGLSYPAALVVGGGGRLWIADTNNNRVLRFDAAGSKPNGAAADGVLGTTSFTSKRPVFADVLAFPSSVVIDPTTGKVFVADSENSRVLRFPSRSSLRNGAAAEAVLGQPDLASNARATSLQGMIYPVGLAVDEDGRLWVADAGNNRVLRFDAAARKPNGAAADGVLGQPDFTSAAAAITVQGMRRPKGVALDGGGRLWVTDTDNNRVLRFDAAADKHNGAAADGVLGQPDFTSYLSATTAEGMYFPDGIAADNDGRLWIVDANNNRVLRFDAAAGKPNGAAADGVLGQPDFTSRDFQTSARGMSFPYSVALDGRGGLWVSDSSNHRVLRFDAAAGKPNGAAADGVLGQPDFTSGDHASLAADRLYRPYGVAVDGSGGIWVADWFNNRVLLFEAVAPAVRPQVYLPSVRR